MYQDINKKKTALSTTICHTFDYKMWWTFLHWRKSSYVCCLPTL